MARIVLHGGRVFDGTGADPADADVVLEDGRIVEVGPGLDGDEGVDVRGRTLLPGLFDCHVHLGFRYEDFDEVRLAYTPFSYRFFQLPETLRWYLAMGITTVRDAGGRRLGDEARGRRRRARRSRACRSPCTMLSMTGGHADAQLPCGGIAPYAVDVPGDALAASPTAPTALRAKVREVIREGADVIKIASSGGFLSPGDDPKLPHFGAGRARRDRHDRARTSAGWVMSHAHGAEGIKRAVRAGVRSIEHGTFLDEEAVGPDGRARHVARADADRRRHDRAARREGRRPGAGEGEAPRRSAGPSSTRSGWRSRPASRSRWGRTARSPRTAPTCASCS